jgi:hypothetical protein
MAPLHLRLDDGDEIERVDPVPGVNLRRQCAGTGGAVADAITVWVSPDVFVAVALSECDGNALNSQGTRAT